MFEKFHGGYELEFFRSNCEQFFFYKAVSFVIGFSSFKIGLFQNDFPKLDYGCELKSLLDQTVSNYFFKIAFCMDLPVFKNGLS